MSGAATLARLQDADDQVATLEREIAAVEEALRRDPEVERAHSAASGAAAQSAQTARDLQSAEQELAALEQRSRTLERTLYGGSVHNPNDLLQMQRDLETLRGQVGAAEERVLQRIEDNERAEEESARARAREEDVRRRRDEQHGPRTARLDELRRRLGEAKDEHVAATAQVTQADLALYRRVSARHQPAVVSIKGDACGGCHLPLSNEERRAVRAGDGIVQCANCDRILVP